MTDDTPDDETPPRNGDAMEFHSLRYRPFRRRAIRQHNKSYHKSYQKNDIPPIHIPVEDDGVVP